MKLYAPAYYKNFKCIADKCTHSCCVGWEIDIDSDTLKKYESMQNDYKSTILESISKEGDPHFRLGECERCPHLDSRGLCKIIIHAGEEYLCDICREHPRFYNYTSVCEVGIGMSCIEAARVILSSPDYKDLPEIGEVDTEADDTLFDGRTLRSEAFEILSGNEPYAKKLEKLYRTYAIDPREDGHWLSILESLEYLNEEHKSLFMNYSSALRPTEKDKYLERFLAYFIYRHCTEAADEYDFCDRLSFCLFCERLFASLICHTPTGELAELASIISEELEYSEDNTLALTY